MPVVAVEQNDKESASTSWITALAPALTLCVIAVTALPLFVSSLPAADDFLNHLARCYVILTEGSDPLLDRFYAIDWKVVPNLAIDLIVPPLAALFDIFVAAKLFTVLSLALLLSGPHAVQYALYGRMSVGPLVAALFVYNKIHKFGNVNYELSVGLAMWAIAVWISSSRASPRVRGAVSAACIIVLFFAHAMGLVLYAVAIASVEAERLLRRPSAARYAALLLPFGVAIVLLGLGPQSDEFVLPMRWGGVESRVQAIRSTFFAYYWKLDLAALGAIALGLAWCLWQRVLEIPRRAQIFALAGTLLFLVIPNEAMGAWGAAVRLPIGLIFVAVGMVRWNFGAHHRRLAFLAVLTVIASLRGGAAAHAYYNHDLLAQDMRKSLSFVAPGSRVLVAREWDNEASALSAIQSLPCLAIIERSSLESLAFVHPMQQVLTVKSPFREAAGGLNDDPVPLTELLHPSERPPDGGFFFAPAGRIYWRDWQRDYDYVYVLDRVDAASPAQDKLRHLYSGGRFQLYGVLH